VIPQPAIAHLRRSKSVLQRHLREPPRKRRYQTMFPLS
jgi:hypothetical protein